MTDLNSSLAQNELFALLAALQDDDALLQELKKSDLTENEASLIESQGFDYELIIEGCLKIQREALTANSSPIVIESRNMPLIYHITAIKKLIVEAESGPLKSRFLEYQQVIQSLAGGKGSSWTKSITQAADQIGDDANDVYEQTSSAVSNTAQAIGDTGKAAGDALEGKTGNAESEINKTENSFKEAAGETGKTVADISKAQNELTSAVAGSELANQTEKIAKNTAEKSLSNLGKAAIDEIGGNKAGAENELKNAGNSAVNGLDQEDKVIATEGESELKSGTDNGKLFEALNFGQKEGLGSFLQKNVYDPAMNALQSFGNTTEADRAEAFKKEGETMKAWGDETYNFAKDEPKELSEMAGSAIKSGENWAEYGLSMGTDKKAEDRAKQDDIQAQTAGVNALDDADKETFTTFDAGMAAVADTSDGLVGNDTGKAADMALGLIPGVGEAVMAGEVLSTAAEMDYDHNMKNKYENEEQKYQQEMQQYNEQNQDGRQRGDQDVTKQEQGEEKDNSRKSDILNSRESNAGEYESREIRKNSEDKNPELYAQSERGEPSSLNDGRNESRDIRADRSEIASGLYSNSSSEAGISGSDQRRQENPSLAERNSELEVERNVDSSEIDSKNEGKEALVARQVEMGDGQSVELSDSVRTELSKQTNSFLGKQQSLEEDYGIGKISRGEYEVRTIENAQSLLRSQAQVFPQDAKQYEIGTRLLSLYSEYQNEFTNNQFKRGSEESIGSNEIESRVLENRQESNEDRSRTSNQGADQSGDATQKNQGLQHLEQWSTNTVGAGIAQLTINILASKSEEVATKMKNVLSEKIDNEFTKYEDKAVLKFSDSCDRAYADFQDWLKGDGTTENRDKVEEEITKRESGEDKTEQVEQAKSTNIRSDDMADSGAKVTPDNSSGTDRASGEAPPPPPPSEPSYAPEGGEIVFEE